MDIKRTADGQKKDVDPVFGRLFAAREYVKQNSKAVTAVVAIIAAVAIGAFAFMSIRESNIRKAQELFGLAVLDYSANNLDSAVAGFVNAATNYGSTPVGAMSAFMAGSIYLNDNQPVEAIRWFEVALRGPRNSLVRGSAHEGIAAAYELNGNVNMAVHHLERALADPHVSHRHNAIRWRLALLQMDRNRNAAKGLFEELLADTTSGAAQYHQRADNLLAILNAL